MKLKLTQDFPDCTPEQLWDVFLDPRFDERLKAESGVQRELLEKRDEDGVTVIRRRVISDKKIPRLMQKALGADRIEYEQTSRLDRSKSTLEWTIQPAMMAERISIAGVTTITSTGSGCQRVIDGDISIRIALVGKKMEKRLAENIEETYTRAAEIAREMLQERA